MYIRIDIWIIIVIDKLAIGYALPELYRESLDVVG
jgi:hypothetical protein